MHHTVIGTCCVSILFFVLTTSKGKFLEFLVFLVQVFLYIQDAESWGGALTQNENAKILCYFVTVLFWLV